MDACDIILQPVVTERSMNLVNDRKHTFDVFVSATRTQVRNAIEGIFDVGVENVNIVNIRGKEKRVGRYTGRTARHGKVIVTSTEDSDGIRIFSDNKEN